MCSVDGIRLAFFAGKFFQLHWDPPSVTVVQQELKSKAISSSRTMTNTRNLLPTIKETKN